MFRLAMVAVLACLVVCGSMNVQAEVLSEQEMSARIDSHLAEVWEAEKIEPAPLADDAEFLRRAWLDLTGIIPPINEQADDGDYGVRGFLADTSEDKRARLINYLLSKPNHATHFSNIWKNVMLPDESNVQRFGGDAGFQNWLRGQFADNMPYDEMVRTLVLANGAANQTGPALFYTALELKPEELAASTSRIFLGTQIQCAQCHDHPFDHWTRADFWGYAAFFARLQRPAGQQQFAFQVADAESGELTIPETEEVVLPTYLGEQISPDDDRSRRVRLAQWLTAPENPYFARATVNRVWALMFGRGLVDPVDDLGTHNPASHPVLLDDLASYFSQTGFDLNRFIRTVAYTQAYQRTSRSLPEGDVRPELFARMSIKSLTAEQLYDCLQEAMRRREPAAVQQQGQFAINRGFDQNRQTFLEKFRAPTQGATEYEAGIPQALTLMNGAIVREATDLGQSDLLVALEAPFFSDEKRVEVLFLSTVSRMPSNEELENMAAYVEKGGATNNRREALGDILWALLNSAEFVFNH